MKKYRIVTKEEEFKEVSFDEMTEEQKQYYYAGRDSLTESWYFFVMFIFFAIGLATVITFLIYLLK